MPRAKPVQLTPEEAARAERARAKQQAAKEEERRILADARARVKKEQAKATRRNRKAETFRYVLVGIVALKEAQADPAKMETLIGKLTRYYTTPRERAALEVLGVPPLPAPLAPIEQDVMPPDTPAHELPMMPVQGIGEGIRLVRH